MQKLIVSLKLSRYCPRLCFDPQRRAARPSSPSRTTPAITRTEASSHRPSITYVIARKPTIAFTTVITSAGETLRTHSIRHLCDRGRPRPQAVALRDRQPASRWQDEFDPRPAPDETDALALLDFIPGPQVRDDATGEDPRELRQAEHAEGRRKLPVQALVPRGRWGRCNRIPPGAPLLFRDNARDRRAVHVDVGEAHEDRHPPGRRVSEDHAPVGRGHDPAADLAPRVSKEEEEREECQGERDRDEAEGHLLEDQNRGGKAGHDHEGCKQNRRWGPAGDHRPPNRPGR